MVVEISEKLAVGSLHDLAVYTLAVELISVQF